MMAASVKQMFDWLIKRVFEYLERTDSAVDDWEARFSVDLLHIAVVRFCLGRLGRVF